MHIKAEIFDGLDIRNLSKDDEFVNSINDLELRAWTSFIDMMKNFLGYHLAKNYKELVEKLLKILQDLDANMSIKVHFLHSHLDKFPDNYSNVKDDLEKQFHQDMKTMEEHYQGQWNKQMMAEYCWSIKRDLNNIEHDVPLKHQLESCNAMALKWMFVLLLHHRHLHHIMSNRSICVALRHKCQSDLMVTSTMMKRRSDEHTKTQSWFINKKFIHLIVVEKRETEYEPNQTLKLERDKYSREERESADTDLELSFSFSVVVRTRACSLVPSLLLHSGCEPPLQSSPKMGTIIFSPLHIVMASVQLSSLHRCVSCPTVTFPVFYPAFTPTNSFSI